MSYYPPQSPYPSGPPPAGPESDYYDDYEYEDDQYEDNDVVYDEDEGGSYSTYIFGCLGCGCLASLGLFACAALLVALWYIDPGADLIEPASATAEIGESFDTAAFRAETITNAQGVQLSIIDVNRNADSNTIPQIDNTEIVVVTVLLENYGSQPYDYDDALQFNLLHPLPGDQIKLSEYPATPGAIEDALDFGRLDPGTGTEGRLVFQIVANQPNLVLEWISGEDVKRYIRLQ